VILDLDGLLIDSEVWSWQAHNQVLAAHGLPPLSLEEVRRLIGLDGEDEWATVRSMRPLPDDRHAYAHSHTDAFIALRSRGLAPLPGVEALMETVTRLDLRLGLASNSPLPSILAALEGLSIRRYFSAVASADEVVRGKPQPDVYLLALERLGLTAEQAIAVEDSRAGITAAQAAGLYCAVVPSELTAGQDLSAAHRRFASLHEVAAWLSRHALAQGGDADQQQP
jgi:HAD superfamily hydrolase (TIGR01509 family)